MKSTVVRSVVAKRMRVPVRASAGPVAASRTDDCFRTATSHGQRVHTMIESLEARRMLAIVTDFTGGVLRVTGDAEPNRVGIVRDATGSNLLVRSGDVTLR